MICRALFFHLFRRIRCPISCAHREFNVLGHKSRSRMHVNLRQVKDEHSMLLVNRYYLSAVSGRRAPLILIHLLQSRQMSFLFGQQFLLTLLHLASKRRYLHWLNIYEVFMVNHRRICILVALSPIKLHHKEECESLLNHADDVVPKHQATRIPLQYSFVYDILACEPSSCSPTVS